MDAHAIAAAPPIFEGHHRGLAERLHALGSALDTCRRKRRTGEDALHSLHRCMTGLHHMAAMHFADEEKLMEDVLYPELQAHAAQHRDFLRIMEELTLQVRTTVPPDATLDVLASWWHAHAQGADRALTEFLCRGGV